MWTVWRHGGQAPHGWRKVGRDFKSYEQAKQTYDDIAKALRQGAVKLCDPEGSVVDRTSGPRLRTRW